MTRTHVQTRIEATAKVSDERQRSTANDAHFKQLVNILRRDQIMDQNVRRAVLFDYPSSDIEVVRGP